jgi:hypothetical protein
LIICASLLQHIAELGIYDLGRKKEKRLEIAALSATAFEHFSYPRKYRGHVFRSLAITNACPTSCFSQK